MMRKFNLLSAAAGCSLIIGAMPAYAQSADAVAETGEIVVTAQKREERLLDIPLSVTAVGGEALANAGLSELSEVAQFSPGLYWQNINISKPQVFIRGYGTTGFDAGGDPSVAVYLDDIYMPRFSGMSMELLDVERVEVLKGPQGTLFGRNAAGGAINVISSRPTADVTGKFKVGYAKFDEIEVAGTASGPLADNVRARISFSSRNGDGYVDVIGSPRDAFDTNRAVVRGQLEFDIGEASKLLLSLDRGRVREGMWGMKNSGQAIPQKHPSVTVPISPDRLAEAYDFNGYQNADTWGLSARLESELGFADLTSITAFRNSTLDELTDFDASPADAIRRQFAEESDSIQQELRLTSSGSGPVNWIGGLYYFHENVDRLGQFFTGRDNTFVIGIGPFPGNNRIPFSNLDTRTIKTTSLAAFGQVNWEITDTLKLTVGGRYSQDRKSMDRSARTIGATDLVNPFLDAAFDVVVKDKWTSFDPAIILDYHVSKDTLIYASYREGYKSGGFQTDPVPNATAARVTFDPERVSSWEAGLKTDLFDRRMKLSTAVFLNKYDNLQFLSTISLGNGQFASLIDNIAKAEAKGFEIDIAATPIDGLKLSLGYAYLDSQYKRYTTPAGVNLAGRQTSRSPKNTLNARAAYSFDVGPGEIELAASASYTDRFFFEASNPAVFARSDSYTLVDGSLSYETEDSRWRFSLWGKNMTNKLYRTHNIVIIVTPNPLVAASLDTYARPRTYGASVTLNF